MAKINRWGFAVAAVSLCVVSVRAQEAGLEPLAAALQFSRVQIRAFRPRPLMTPEQQEFQSEAVRFLEQQPGLPAPDAQTSSWLAKRVPGLDLKNVKVVSFDLAEAVMARAAAGKGTWMDIVSDPAFRGTVIYYLSQDSLNRLNAKYSSGLIPVQGTTENGQPFQMQGFLAGQGRVELLFDKAEFTFKDYGKRFKIDNGGRLTATIRAPGDINTQGYSAYGAPIVCPWARIQRMTKESMYKLRVETSCGTRGGNDLHPVQKR